LGVKFEEPDPRRERGNPVEEPGEAAGDLVGQYG
jgi:hypothetical protein